MTLAAAGPPVVLVTGAAGGIGLAVVRRLLGAGYAVAATDAAAEALAELHGAVDAVEGRLTTHDLDVTDAAAVQAVVDHVAGRQGRLDGLVNNAGVFGEGSVIGLDEPEWQHVLDVNLLGAWRCLRVVARHMVRAGRGRIVNVASVAGLGGAPLASHYAASKSALISLTRSSACELAAHGVTVNAVVPGLVDTGMMAGRRTMIERMARSRVPRGRIADPDEVAEAVAFLLTSRTDYITGAALVIDGGMSAA